MINLTRSRVNGSGTRARSVRARTYTSRLSGHARVGVAPRAEGKKTVSQFSGKLFLPIALDSVECVTRTYAKFARPRLVRYVARMAIRL